MPKLPIFHNQKNEALKIVSYHMHVASSYVDTFYNNSFDLQFLSIIS